MKCPYCGNKMKSKDTFCSSCGFRMIKPPVLEEKKPGYLVSILIGISVSLCLAGILCVVYFVLIKKSDNDELAANISRKTSEEEIDSVFTTEKIVFKSDYDETFEGGTIYDRNDIKIVMSDFCHRYGKANVEFSILNQNDHDITVKCEAYSINGRMKYKSVDENFMVCNIGSNGSSKDYVDIERQLGEQGIEVIENMDFLFTIYSDNSPVDTFQSSVVTSKSDGDNNYVPYPYLFENDIISVQYSNDYEGLFVANKTDEYLTMNILKVKVNGILVGYEYITSNLKYDILGNTKAVVYLTLSQNFYDDNDIDYINDISYTIEYKLSNGTSETIELDPIQLTVIGWDDGSELYVDSDDSDQGLIDLDIDIENTEFRKDITYNDLARRPDDYLGEYVEVTGKVIQLIEDNGENVIRVSLNSNGYDDVIICAYDPSINEERILEDDTVTIRGVSAGIIQYESTLGGMISVPALYGAAIDIN